MLIVLTLGIITVGILTSCWAFSRQIEDEDQVKYLIGVSQANLSEPWRVIMNKEIEEEAARYKDIRIIFTDAAHSNQKQIKDVKKLIQLGIDLLIISPNDSSALTPVVTEAYKTIPVIVLDRAVEGYDYTLFIGPDNKLIGKQAGEFVGDLLGKDGGNVIEVQGLRGSPPVGDRSEGFREVIDRYENIKIVDTIVADWLRDKAEDRLKAVIEMYPEVDVLFAHNDHMALGTYRAAADFGFTDINIIGVDGLTGENGGLELVRKGILTGTFTCPTGGKEAVQYALDILSHQTGIPKKIILRSKRITKENVFEYTDGKGELTKSRQEPEREIVLGFSQVDSDESGWRIANSNSIKSAATEAGISLIFLDAQQKQENQIKAIREFIAQKVDVIAFSPIVESGWEEVLKEAKEAGIPVILSDRAVKVEDNSLYTTFIGADFVEEGRRAARWLCESIAGNEEVNIVELQGTIGADPTIGRKKGFKEILKDYPNFKIIGSQSGNYTFEQGKEVMRKFLKEEGRNIHAVYAHNDDMALGAIEAIEEYGLKPGSDIKLVSVDATKGAFKAMIEGKLNCTVECNPLLGPQLMKAVKDVAAGKQMPIRIITEEGVFPQEAARREYVNRKY